MKFEIHLHIPVLAKEVLQHLDPKPNENFIDCTVGEGGHANLILEKTSPNGKVLGIDWDAEQIKRCRENTAVFGGRIILANDSYANLREVVGQNNFNPISGILLDLGFSSRQIEESGKGFSFFRNEPLDMRYNTKISNYKSQNPKLTAERIVNEYPREKLEEIFREYGEERFANSIAENIVLARKKKPILTTAELVGVVEKSVPYWYRKRKIHCATRIFQALRIAVNNELNNLKEFLPQAVSVLGEGGRMAIISFHSLEDRIVKNFFRDIYKSGVATLLTKKPVMASREEVFANTRSRSAKLRAIIKK